MIIINGCFFFICWACGLLCLHLVNTGMLTFLFIFFFFYFYLMIELSPIMFMLNHESNSVPEGDKEGNTVDQLRPLALIHCIG